MKSNRRKFLKYSGLSGIGLAIADRFKAIGTNTDSNLGSAITNVNKTNNQHFNMCGSAAP